MKSEVTGSLYAMDGRARGASHFCTERHGVEEWCALRLDSCATLAEQGERLCGKQSNFLWFAHYSSYQPSCKQENASTATGPRLSPVLQKATPRATPGRSPAW